MVDNTPPPEFRGQLKWKEKVIQSLKITPSQAETGRPIMLVGRRWADVAKDKSQAREGVLHRSPTDVSDFQARILLVLDVKVKMKALEECNCGLVH